MKISDTGLAFIKGFEGLILGAYDDADDRIVHLGQHVYGTLTIGYGHTSVAGPPRVYVGQEITHEQADAILLADLASVEIEVGHLVKVPLSQNQLDALVDFQFNTGWLSHQHSSLLTVLNSGNYRLADQDFMLYDRSRGKVIKGLCRRRAAERDLFNGGSTNA